MDQTDFAIAMVSGVLIIMVVFLYLLFRIFGIRKKTRPMMTLLPEITKLETHEFQPEKFVTKPQEIEEIEKEFQKGRDLQRKEPVKEIIMEKKEDIPLNESIKEILSSPIVLQSIEENEKLKLKDNLIEVRDVNTQKKAKKKRHSSKDFVKTDKLKERVTPEKNPEKRPVRKKKEKSSVPLPEQVLKGSEERPPRKKPGKKEKQKKITQTIATENPVSGES